MALKVNELADKINQISQQLDKATTEIKTEIQGLKDSLANTEIPAEAQASIDRLSTLAQTLDDLNPDPVPTPTPEQPPTPPGA